ncbi:MAG: hypothetical protein GF350_00010 [Chitinivibrionales bacterium]|nr:hypothetical protein [Chitinivibrionales bacterium]
MKGTAMKNFRHICSVAPCILCFFAACSFLNNEQGINFITETLRPEKNPTPGQSREPGNPETGLVACWSFNESSNTIAADCSGNNHTGTILNAISVEGIDSNALSFAGHGSGVDVADHEALALTGDFSISAWINIAGLKAPHSIVVFRGDSRPGLDPYLITVLSNGMIQFQIQDVTDASNRVKAEIDTGRFVHVCAVHDTEKALLKLYLDGELAGTTPATIRPLADLDSGSRPGLGIGHHAMRTGNDYGFTGIVDEVRIYSRVLDTNEIAMLAML